jgi:hypothetical protein
MIDLPGRLPNAVSSVRQPAGIDAQQVFVIERPLDDATTT